jgi:hypothetical protein
MMRNHRLEEKERAQLVALLIEINHSVHHQANTLFVAVNILDRFLSLSNFVPSMG